MFEHPHAAELGDLVQVEVVGDNLPLQGASKLNQLQIDFANLGEVDVRDGDVHAGHLLDLLQDVEAAAAAVALQRVGGIGDQLQLLEDELRDHERAIEKAGLADVGDAAVDDDAGVEDAIALLRAGVAEQADQALRLPPLPFPGPHDDPQVGEDQQGKGMEKGDAARWWWSAQNNAAPMVLDSPRPMAPPIRAPRRSVTSALRMPRLDRDHQDAEQRAGARR